MSMRTPLARVRGLGSARSGTERFWRQRVTSVALVPLSVFLVLFIATGLGASHAETVVRLRQPLVAVIFLGVVITSAIHMRIGMKEIIEDYVHGEGAKVACVLANTFICAAVALASAYAILKISFGG